MFCFRIIIRDSLPFEAVQDLEIMTELGTTTGQTGCTGQTYVQELWHSWVHHWANAPGRALIVRPTPPRHRISLNLIFYTSHHGDQFNWAPDHLPHICSIFWVWLSICWCTLLLDRTQRSVWIEFDWLMGISGCTWPQGWVMQHPSHQSIYRWSLVNSWYHRQSTKELLWILEPMKFWSHCSFIYNCIIPIECNIDRFFTTLKLCFPFR